MKCQYIPSKTCCRKITTTKKTPLLAISSERYLGAYLYNTGAICIPSPLSNQLSIWKPTHVQASCIASFPILYDLNTVKFAPLPSLWSVLSSLA